MTVHRLSFGCVYDFLCCAKLVSLVRSLLFIFAFTDGLTTSEKLLRYALTEEFRYLYEASLAAVAMVGEGHVQNLVAEEVPSTKHGFQYACFLNSKYESYLWEIANIKDVDLSTLNISWVDGEKTTLGAWTAGRRRHGPRAPHPALPW